MEGFRGLIKESNEKAVEGADGGEEKVEHDGLNVDKEILEQFRMTKFRILGGRDKQGRKAMNLRMRFHNPKEVPPRTMLRTIACMMMNVLRG